MEGFTLAIGERGRELRTSR